MIEVLYDQVCVVSNCAPKCYRDLAIVVTRTTVISCIYHYQMPVSHRDPANVCNWILTYNAPGTCPRDAVARKIRLLTSANGPFLVHRRLKS